MLFIENFHMFYIDEVSVDNPRITPISVTNQVIPEVVIHGIPDWIYEGFQILFMVKQK